MYSGPGKEDGQEQCCCGNRGCIPGSAVDIRRVTDRLDELQARGDTDGAARLLEYWLNEARAVSDTVGELRIENEFAGFCRKEGREAEALAHAGRALELVEICGVGGTSLEGTTCINAATVYTAFGQAGKAMPLFEQAKAVYERVLPQDDGRLGGLYNNMGLCAGKCGRYEEAEACFNAALRVMRLAENGEAEEAITWLNIADLIHARTSEECEEDEKIEASERICECVEKAWTLLNTPTLPKDAYYCYVCEKCAPVFGFYGYFDLERQCGERAAR